MGIGDHLRYAHASTVSPASAISVVRRSRVGRAAGTGRGPELTSGSAAAHQPLAGHVEPRDMTVLPLPLELDRRGHRAHAAAADFGRQPQSQLQVVISNPWIRQSTPAMTDSLT